jgi:hypothetical protein
MGYNASEIITRFVRYAGQPHGYEPGQRGRSRERFPDGQGSSLLYAQDRQGRVTEIQSYGPHFPLATLILHPSGRRKMWLLNGDRWPGGGFGRTNEHNDIARMAAQASGTPCFIVPFSALRAASIDPATITPVQIEPERWTQEEHTAAALADVPEDHRKRARWITPDGREVAAPVTADGRHAWPDERGYGDWYGSWYVQTRRLGEAGYGWYRDNVPGPLHLELQHDYAVIERGADKLYHWSTERHWLGASLFRARYREEGSRIDAGGRRTWHSRNHWAHFVTAFDYNEPRPLWFMSQLPRGIKPATVAEAIDALKPRMVKTAESFGMAVQRQGDVFVIPVPGVTSERELITAGGAVIEPSTGWGERGRYINDSHTATRVVRMPDGTFMVRGILRHNPAGRRPDHVRQDLWDRQTWGRVVFNTQARSFDASPRSWSMGGNVD